MHSPNLTLFQHITMKTKNIFGLIERRSDLREQTFYSNIAETERILTTSRYCAFILYGPAKEFNKLKKGKDLKVLLERMR